MTETRRFELAAKAAGIPVAMVARGVAHRMEGPYVMGRWDPQFNGVDALDLMIRLGIRVQQDSEARTVTADCRGIIITQRIEHSALHAARLAAFDVAVEVGRSLPDA